MLIDVIRIITHTIKMKELTIITTVVIGFSHTLRFTWHHLSDNPRVGVSFVVSFICYSL